MYLKNEFMRTPEEFEQFYNETLLPCLRDFEERRKKIRRHALTLNIIMVCLTPALFSLVLFYRTEAFLKGFTFLFLGYLLVWTFLLFRIKGGFITDFKKNVIGTLVSFIDRNLSFIDASNTKRVLYQALFNKSKLFDKAVNDLIAEDYVSGKVNGVNVWFADVIAPYLFKGLFFTADFNKKFKGETFILPQYKGKAPGKISATLRLLSRKEELVHLEDPEFEKLFVVYSSDQIEARYILSIDLMRRIVDFRKKAGRDVYISFVNSKVFVAISCDENLFEPKIYKTVLNFDNVRQYFEDLRLAMGIVEDLSLTTKIWSE